MTITELQTNLETVRTAIDDTIKTGKAGNIVGSIGYTNLTLDELRAEEKRIMLEILKKVGYRSTTL